MTRLLHGFTILAGTCALTLVVGCGGSSTPKVQCDGGGCGDAKRDTSGTKYDGSVVTKYDGPAAQPDGPVVAQPDGPVAQPDGPVAQPDGPAVTLRDGPAVTQPDGSTVTLRDGPNATPDGEKQDTSPAKEDVVVQKFDVKNDTSGTPDVGFDAPAPLFDVAQDLAVDAVTDVLEDASEAGDATEAGEAG
jgi:hypothetical protein